MRLETPEAICFPNCWQSGNEWQQLIVFAEHQLGRNSPPFHNPRRAVSDTTCRPGEARACLALAEEGVALPMEGDKPACHGRKFAELTA